MGGTADVDDLAAFARQHDATWMALLKKPSGNHWVIVDDLDEADLMTIRDPASLNGLGGGFGTRATMILTDS
ncbi:hypothetical protein [Leptonema illini]|uniref:hypothetical protein n=1 Tax=Leptonema illini TaxID=183 RepID=UPI000594052B|nr:hypothetical protein [Leptonema illini]